MNREPSQEIDPRLATAATGSRQVAHPIVLTMIGAVSLFAFGAAGWSLGRMRAAGPTVSAVSAPAPMTEPKAIARGRLVYQVQCARCHGPSGHGDGTDAPTLKTPPRDLAAVLGSRSDDVIRRSITEGIAGTAMTGFGQLLSPRELDSLLEFVRSLAKDSRPAQSADQMPAPLAEMLTRAGFVPDARSRTAPQLEVRAANGKTTSLDGLHGSLVLVVFWGTSCASCVDELPELERLAERYSQAGLTVLPVCLDQTIAAEAEAVAAAHTRGLPVYVDPDGFARLRYDVQGLPTAVLIDRQGRMLGTAQGAKNWADSEVHTLITSCLNGS